VLAAILDAVNQGLHIRIDVVGTRQTAGLRQRSRGLRRWVDTALSLLAGLFLLLAAGWVEAAETFTVGPEGVPMALDDALHLAQDGDTIGLLAGQYRGTLVIEGRRLTLRGVDARPPVVNGEGKVRDARALWTVRGGTVTLENIEFRGARSSDGSGAGLRQEGGQLTVTRCGFYDNEYGLLASNVDAAELRIASSVFAGAPKVVGGLYHLLNVGRIAKLEVTASRFQQGFEGHLIKSRARDNLIAYNFIHDGVRGTASYEIELASGGLATVIGNVIAKGTEASNRVLVAYGSEGRAWDRNELYLAHNTFINYGWSPAWFLRVFTDRLPDKLQVHAVNNLLVGPGVFWPAVTGHLEGNRHATRGMLRDIWTYGFELPPDSLWRGSAVDPRNINGHNLAPTAEFEWPAQVRALPPGRTQWSPGAFQR
jgi:hypothetical protein